MNHATAAGRVRWIAAVALTALLAGLVAWFIHWRPVVAPPAAEITIDPLAAFDDTSEAVVDQALAQIPADSTELKQRWVDEVKDVDVTGLSPRQLDHFVRMANAQGCTCGCGYTLAACRTYDPSCPVSLPRAEELRDSVRAGLAGAVVHLRPRPPNLPRHPDSD
jgi:hypothetical protein